jgi:hypothetical protein
VPHNLETGDIRKEPRCAFSKDNFKWPPRAPFQGTFPNDPLTPSGSSKRGRRACINVPVAVNLRLPEFRPAGGPSEEVAIMAVPEASMREKNRVISRKDNIRSVDFREELTRDFR